MTTINPDNRPPTAQTQTATAPGDYDIDSWLRIGQDAYRASTSYVDNNLRKQWEDGIRAFHSQHAADSKYNAPAFEKRSRLFRPKTRSVIRKNEAAAAAAFFSSMDVVSVEAPNQSDKKSVVGAELMKSLLQYRLTNSVKWFHLVQGGLQDAQTLGAACAHVYWKYESKEALDEAEIAIAPVEAPETEYPEQKDLPKGAFTMAGDQVSVQEEVRVQVAVKAKVRSKPTVDKPCVDLVPIENIRVDPAADWTDPINSSPYVIHLIPMYAMDVQEKSEKGDWFPVSDGELQAASGNKTDSTRSARANSREDPTTSDSKSILGHEIVWVQRHIHRRSGTDWEFYMLDDQIMLSNPVPLETNVLHGMRPYVMGCCVLEAHRAYPTSIATLGKGLQDETNEIANQRIDNVKFVLNKKWFVKRGKDADIGGLVRNVPGGVVMLDDPVGDVREVTTQDVTASSYEEQGRIDNDFADLVGNFSAGQVMADHGINGPARNMAMLNQSSATLVEYLLRTYVETFIQPILNMLVKLEKEYETDELIIGLSAQKVGAAEKLGGAAVTDALLDNEVSLSVNVGMGATDPQMKLQKFVSAMNIYVGMVEKHVAGIDMKEVGKEIFGHLGYSDGSRFFTNENPQVLQLQQQLQQTQQALAQAKAKLADKKDKHLVDIHKVSSDSQTKLAITNIKEAHADQRAAITHLRAINEDLHKGSLDKVSNKMSMGDAE